MNSRILRPANPLATLKAGLGEDMEAHGPAPSKRRLLFRAILLSVVLVIELIVLVADKKDYIVPFLESSQRALYAVDPFIVAKYWLRITPTCTPSAMFPSAFDVLRNRPVSDEQFAKQAEYWQCLEQQRRIKDNGVFAVFSDLSVLSLILALLSYGLFAIGWLYWRTKNNIPFGASGGLIPVLVGGTAT